MRSRERAILDFLNDIAPLNMHGFMVTLKGETLAEGYWAPYSAGEPHRLYSVSKSMVSAAIGILSHDGLISLDTPIVSCFPEYTDEHTSTLLREVTIRDMLKMATCYDRAQYSPLDDDNWTKPFFYGNPTHVPGTVFSYDTSASQVMAALVEKLTGEPLTVFLEKRLFPALGMTGEKLWLKDRSGTSQGGTGLVMTLRDFSRFASFWLTDGLGLVDSSYIREATSRQIATDERSGPEERYGYGYQLWMMREGFSMYGLAGQMAMVLPEEELILCTTADLMLDSTGVQPLYDAFFSRLKGISQLPSSDDDRKELTERLAGLCCHPIEGKIMAEPVRIALQQGALPFQQILISPDHVELISGTDVKLIQVLPGKWIPGVFLGNTCISTGAWTSPDRYHLHLEFTREWAANLDLYISLKDRRATVRVVSSIWEMAKGWSGQDWGYIE